MHHSENKFPIWFNQDHDRCALKESSITHVKCDRNTETIKVVMRIAYRYRKC